MDWKWRVRENGAAEDYFKISEGSVISETGKTWGREVMIRSSVLDSRRLRCLFGGVSEAAGLFTSRAGGGAGGESLAQL